MIHIDMPVYVKNAILHVEGKKYTNDPKDPGGPTKYGWTLRSYKRIVDKNANIETIKSLSENKAMSLYDKYFWKKYGSYRINNTNIATTLVLTQINLGPSRPNKLIQEMSNEFCPTLPHLKKDGILGEKSLYNINNCKYLWPGYPYVVYYLYSNSKSISGVWKWARNGLVKRIFYSLHEEK